MQKKGIRILAIDDSSFSRSDSNVLVIGVIGREDVVEGVISFYVERDGADSTAKILGAISKSRFNGQVRIIAMNGMVLGGLNVVDAYALNRRLGVPVIAVTRKRPHARLLENAIRKSGKEIEKKISVLDRVNRSIHLTRRGGFYFQCLGINDTGATVADNAVRLLRLAHMIATGMANGESKGRL